MPYTVSDLREALQLGLSIVTELWNYKTKDWVTGIHALDIDNDGETEILVGSRDGRIHLLTQQGICCWERIVGRKKWIGAVVGIPVDENHTQPARIFVGTQDGKIYVYDRDGNVIRKNAASQHTETHTLENEYIRDEQSFWHSSTYAIRQLIVQDSSSSQILIDSEDRDIYTLDYLTGAEHRGFQSNSIVNVITTYDVNNDGKLETLVGTRDQHLYILDHKGQAILPEPYDVPGQLHCLCAAELNKNGCVAMLLGIDGKILSALDLQGKPLWRRSIVFNNRFRMLCVADIDGDGQNEILVGSEDKHLYILDNEGNEIWRHLLEDRISSLCALDIDNDGQIEVLVGTQDNIMHVLRIRPIRGLDEKIRTLYQKIGRLPLNKLSTLFPDQSSLLHDLLNEANSLEESVTAEAVEQLAEVEKRDPKLALALLHDLINEANSLEEPVTAKAAEQLIEVEKRDPKLALALLHDLINEPRPAVKPATLEQVNGLYNAKKYDQALDMALLLKQQKVQEVWQKGRIGSISALSFGDISQDSRREVIAGTKTGMIYAFDAQGHELWFLPLSQAIQGLQTGYFETTRWERILACTADHKLYIISGVIQENGRRTKVIGNVVNIHEEPDEHLSSLHVYSPGGKKGPLHIVLGTDEKTIVVYKGTLQNPILKLNPPHGVRIVAAYFTEKENIPAIVAGCAEDVEHSVYAYNQNGKLLWTYPARGRIEALCIKDIDGDEKIEVVIGSQDRNIHVVDQNGELKWRYYLPNFVLALDVHDINGDGKSEILAGCDDGQLYVFSYEGDLLWKYQAHGSVQAVQVYDIDSDSNIEIALGSESVLEVLRIVNQSQLDHLINQCWIALQQQRSTAELIRDLLGSQSSHYLRGFALQKLAEISPQNADTFTIFATFMKDGSIEVRKSLLLAVITCYNNDPKSAQSLLNHFVTDQDREFKYFMVKQIADFMCRDDKRNWEDGLKYLQRLATNNSRSVRRAVMHQIFTLVGDFYGQPERKNAIFNLLLAGLLEPPTVAIQTSDWVRKEAARTFAHFIDYNQGDLLFYIHLLIVKDVRPDIVQHIAYHVSVPLIKHICRDLAKFISGLNEGNILSRLEMVVNTLKEMRSLKYGEETFLIYREFQIIHEKITIDDIAQYQCSARGISGSTSLHFKVLLSVLLHLNLVTRALRQYLRRNDIKDRVNSLLEANIAIDKTRAFASQEYMTKVVLGEPLAKLPDWPIINLFLERWQNIITRELHELGGSTQLVVELQTKKARFEKQVVVCLLLRNTGHSTANDIHVELLNSKQFDVIGQKAFETDEIFAHDEAIAEFTIQPFVPVPTLNFEIVYEDTDGETFLNFEDQLELSPAINRQNFTAFDNPYSRGIPTSDMCYGREEDLHFLKKQLSNMAARIVTIFYGQRRSGKTTILFQLSKTSFLEPHIPVLIDMQMESVNINDSRLFYKIARRIATTLQEKEISIPPISQEDFVDDPTFAFDIFLRDVEKELKPCKLILLIDEFEVLEQQVQKKALSAEIFDYLRSMIQHHPYVTFLFSGVHSIQQLTTDYWSTFFNIAEHYRLTRLQPEAATRLIVEPVERVMEYDTHAIRKIHQLTADEPFLIHIVCRALVDYCIEKEKGYVTINDVNVVLNKIMENGQLHFEWIWNQSDKEERYILAMIAGLETDDRKQVSLIEIEEEYRRNLIPYKRENILKALKDLKEKDIIEQVIGENHDEISEEARYTIPVGLIRRWLRTQKPIKKVLRERDTTLSS